MHAIVGDGVTARGECVEGVVVEHRAVVGEGARFEGAKPRLFCASVCTPGRVVHGREARHGEALGDEEEPCVARPGAGDGKGGGGGGRPWGRLMPAPRFVSHDYCRVVMSNLRQLRRDERVEHVGSKIDAHARLVETFHFSAMHITPRFARKRASRGRHQNRVGGGGPQLRHASRGPRVHELAGEGLGVGLPEGPSCAPPSKRPGG